MASRGEFVYFKKTFLEYRRAQEEQNLLNDNELAQCLASNSAKVEHPIL